MAYKGKNPDGGFWFFWGPLGIDRSKHYTRNGRFTWSTSVFIGNQLNTHGLIRITFEGKIRN